MSNTAPTHVLSCSHCTGKNRKNYFMKCDLLGITKSGKAKIMVYGERNWANKEHISHIRYVDQYRINKIIFK